MALSLRRAETAITSKPLLSFLSTSSAAKRSIYDPLQATQQTYLHNDYHNRYSFSTKTNATGFPAPSPEPDKLPSSATTGTIAGHKQPIPTERDIAMAGGVWAVTSAKRDKLGELKGTLGEDHDTLDDVATEDELLDLYLADGIKLITKVTDAGLDTNTNDVLEMSNANDSTIKVLNDFSTWLNNQEWNLSQSNYINRTELETKLKVILAKVDNLLETIPADRCLRNIRDFLDAEAISVELENHDNQENHLGNNNNSNLNINTAEFWDSVIRYRLLLAKASINQLLISWKMFTTVSDADIDRAAAEGISLQPELDTVSLDKVVTFLHKIVSGDCSARATAAWDLIDRDQDGSLDEEEMNQVVHLCLRIEIEAMQALFEETLDASPLRAPLHATGSEDHPPSTRTSWRKRREERKTKKRLMKMFQQSCKKHFDVEVEIDHRLRCIYAWANKADQDNQLKSVLVDEQVGWTGRKRYVELSPKISENEFREVQEIHFKHMNQLGSEIVSSFREDLWLLQGKRRERKDLIRNSFLFLTAVSAVDYVILML